jgi:hypothetical protein
MHLLPTSSLIGTTATTALRALLMDQPTLAEPTRLRVRRASTTSACPGDLLHRPTCTELLSSQGRPLRRLQSAPTATSTARHGFSSRRRQRHQRSSTSTKLSVIFNLIFFTTSVYFRRPSRIPCVSVNFVDLLYMFLSALPALPSTRSGAWSCQHVGRQN